MFQRQLCATVAGIMLVMTIMAAPAAWTQSKPGPESLIGNKLPDTLLNDLTGQPGRISGRTGKVVFVEFWATWCPDCREVAPHVQKLHEQYGNKGLDIVAISVDTKAKTVEKYMAEKKLTYPVLMGNENTRTMFRVLRIPTVYLIDKNGLVNAVYVEYGEKRAPEVDAKVKELLGNQQGKKTGNRQ